MESTLGNVKKKNAHYLELARDIYRRKTQSNLIDISQYNIELLEDLVVANNNEKVKRITTNSNNLLVTFCHLIDPRSIKSLDTQSQHYIFAFMIDNNEIEALKWMVAIGFDPGAKNEDGINVLQYLSGQNYVRCENLKDQDSILFEMAKILIDPKNSTKSLVEDRKGKTLHSRVVGGKKGDLVKEIPAIGGELSKFLISKLDKKEITLSAFNPIIDSDFKECIKKLPQLQKIHDEKENVFSSCFSSRSYKNLKSQINNLYSDQNPEIEILEEGKPMSNPHSAKVGAAVKTSSSIQL